VAPSRSFHFQLLLVSYPPTCDEMTLQIIRQRLSREDNIRKMDRDDCTNMHLNRTVILYHEPRDRRGENQPDSKSHASFIAQIVGASSIPFESSRDVAVDTNSELERLFRRAHHCLDVANNAFGIKCGILSAAGVDFMEYGRTDEEKVGSGVWQCGDQG